MAGCFRDYERCINDGSDIVDNLDCAAKLVACLKRLIFAQELEASEGAANYLGAHSLVDAIQAVLLVEREIRPMIASVERKSA
jgi:hypothetical protein